MSMRSVTAFYGRVAGDKALQAKLNAIRAGREAHGEGALAELVTIAAEAGYEFTASELARVQHAKPRRLPDTEMRTSLMAEDCWEGKNYFCQTVHVCAGLPFR